MNTTTAPEKPKVSPDTETEKKPKTGNPMRNPNPGVNPNPKA